MNMLDDVEFKIAKLALGPEDILVVRIDKPATSMIAAELTAQLARRTGLGRERVLVTDCSLELSVVGRNEIKRAGK